MKNIAKLLVSLFSVVLFIIKCILIITMFIPVFIFRLVRSTYKICNEIIDFMFISEEPDKKETKKETKVL